jgi:hypothetical protein
MYWSTFIIELSDDDMDMWWQACAALLNTFPTLVSFCNIKFTDECMFGISHYKV